MWNDPTLRCNSSRYYKSMCTFVRLERYSSALCSAMGRCSREGQAVVRAVDWTLKHSINNTHLNSHRTLAQFIL